MKTNSKRPQGGQPGNRNAERGGEENDGQFLVRLPRERLPRMKTVAHITGDRGLNAMMRRLIDAELARVEGVKLRVAIKHADALDILRAAGRKPPEIEPGANTAVLWFKTAQGAAVAVNQSGFAPKAADNEEEVNGCLVFVAEGDLSAEEARRYLTEALHRLAGL